MKNRCISPLRQYVSNRYQSRKPRLLLLLLLAPSPNPTAVEHTSRDVGIIAGVIVCVALFIALILVIIIYRSVVAYSAIFLFSCRGSESCDMCSKDAAVPLVGVSALSYLQCFNLVDRKDIQPIKRPCHLSPEVLFWIKWRKNWLTQVRMAVVNISPFGVYFVLHQQDYSQLWMNF